MDEAEKKVVLELTPEEAQRTYDLLDIAIKAGGAQAAKVALPLIDKLMAAVQVFKETQST